MEKSKFGRGDEPVNIENSAYPTTNRNTDMGIGAGKTSITCATHGTP